jgi:hypothetical protein
MSEGSPVSGNEFHMVQRSSDNLQSSINKLFYCITIVNSASGTEDRDFRKGKKAMGVIKLAGRNHKKILLNFLIWEAWERVEGAHPVGDKNG